MTTLRSILLALLLLAVETAVAVAILIAPWKLLRRHI
jgi:hypothetical protein